jgi:hypothetical protein
MFTPSRRQSSQPLHPPGKINFGIIRALKVDSIQGIDNIFTNTGVHKEWAPVTLIVFN